MNELEELYKSIFEFKSNTSLLIEQIEKDGNMNYVSTLEGFFITEKGNLILQFLSEGDIQVITLFIKDGINVNEEELLQMIGKSIVVYGCLINEYKDNNGNVFDTQIRSVYTGQNIKLNTKN